MFYRKKIVKKITPNKITPNTKVKKRLSNDKFVEVKSLFQSWNKVPRSNARRLASFIYNNSPALRGHSAKMKYIDSRLRGVRAKELLSSSVLENGKIEARLMRADKKNYDKKNNK